MKWHSHPAIYLAGVLLLSSSKVTYAQSSASIVRDLPFSANEWLTKTSPAPDGTLSVTTQQIVIARASDGTVRREIHESSAGPDRVVGRPILLVSILNRGTEISSAIFHGKTAVTAMDVSRLKNIPRSPAMKTAPAKLANSPASTQMSSLNGLQALVYRSQYSIPTSDPNAKANIVTSELWYSPDLHVALKSSSSDSDGAAVVSVLDNIQRQEPDSSLFRVSTEAKTTQK